MTVPMATSVEAVRRTVADARAGGLRVGLVPTMGALHAGHLSLIRAARQENGLVVLWLFVNPAQFGPHEDLTRYPRPFERDLELCCSEGVDLVFAPDPATVYPPGFSTWVNVEGLADVLEGASRPGHFRGVCTVVLKLFNMVAADVAYFGQKDAQQVVVLRRMMRDLNVPGELRVCPTIRESDGLALSSRNQYLDPAQRRQAVCLYEALREAHVRTAAGERDANVVRRLMEARIERTPGAVLDYVALVDAETLAPVARLEGRVLLALAVRFGGTRLIDNRVLAVSAGGVAEESL